MAYTLTKNIQTIFGNFRVWGGVVSADAASGVVSFGLSTIDHLEWCPVSMTTDNVKVRRNALAGGTASQGDIGFSGCASGDDMYVTVYGH